MTSPDGDISYLKLCGWSSGIGLLHLRVLHDGDSVQGSKTYCTWKEMKNLKKGRQLW